jgi:hypothetical protein
MFSSRAQSLGRLWSAASCTPDRRHGSLSAGESFSYDVTRNLPDEPSGFCTLVASATCPYIARRDACRITFYFVGVATHPAGRTFTGSDGHFEPAIRLISPNAGSTH